MVTSWLASSVSSEVMPRKKKGSWEPAQDRHTAKRVSKQRSKDVDIFAVFQGKASPFFLIEFIHCITAPEFIQCITVYPLYYRFSWVYLSTVEQPHEFLGCKGFLARVEVVESRPSIVLSFFLSLSILISFFLSLCIVLSFSFSLSIVRITVIVLPLLYYRYCITVIVLPLLCYRYCITVFHPLFLPFFLIELGVQQVVFCDSIKPFGRVGALKTCQGTESNGVRFENRALQKAMRALFDIRCPFCDWAWRAASSSCGTTSGRTTRWGSGARTLSTYLTAGFILDSRGGCGLQRVSDPFIPAASGRQSRLAAAGDASAFWKTPQNSSLLVTPILASNQLASKASGTQSQVLP